VAAEREEYASIYWQPEAAQTENEYEQIEVSISYVRLVPAFFCLILYFYTEFPSNTLPETAQPENEYEQIEVNIYVDLSLFLH
jgi:hypothetical protein